MVVNDISRADIGFDTGDNEVTILTASAPDRRVPFGPKPQVAAAILDVVEALRAERAPTPGELPGATSEAS